MNIKILAVLLEKEMLLITRNPVIPRLILAMPVLVMLIIPLVATLDVRDVAVAVVDNDRTELSRRIVADMDASEYLTVTGCFRSYGEAFRQVESGCADVVVTIPDGYLKGLVSGEAGELDLKANGVNATKGTLGAQYVMMSAAGTVSRWRAEHGFSTAETAGGVTYRYNPTLNFRNYMIPALMVVLLIIICGFLPALNLVSEKESGTIEAMNVTPVGRFVFVLSKLLPYWLVGIVVITVSMLIGWLVYGLVPEGSVACVYMASLLFILVMSGLGLFIANKSATILQAIFMMFAFIIVFQLMSGLFTPVSSMPQWAQCITYAIPPRYYIEIMRAVYLKGAGVADLWPQYAALAGYALLLCLVAAVTYKKRN